MTSPARAVINHLSRPAVGGLVITVLVTASFAAWARPAPVGNPGANYAAPQRAPKLAAAANKPRVEATNTQAQVTTTVASLTPSTTAPLTAPKTSTRLAGPTIPPATTQGSAPAVTTAPAATTTPPATSPSPTNLNGFLVGWTHTQISADSWYTPAAVSSAESILRSTSLIQNQHIYGWGTVNPEPSPGQFDWAGLDSRINLIRRTGAIPVITLCCAPDWMKGAPPGTTDWSRLEVAPNRDHFDDFAQLAALVAQRYPDVKYFQVWNELKGFYNSAANRWDYEGYTLLYNKVYDAVKAVRPDAKLGGPYVVVDSYPSAAGLSNPSAVSGPWGVYDQRPLDVIEYWLANKHGADFLIVDGGIGHRGGTPPADANVALNKFPALHNWIKQRTNLPIWWAEMYPIPDANMSELAQADFTIRTLEVLKSSGAAVVLLWQPDSEGRPCVGCLWLDIKTKGAQPTALAERLKAWLGK